MYPNSLPLRVAAIGLAIAAVAAGTLWFTAAYPAQQTTLGRATVILAALTVMAVILLSPTLYHRWMQLAERLQRVVSTILFGAIYLVFVPILFVISRARDPLGLRRDANTSTFWMARHGEKVSLESLRRMG